MVSGKNIDVAHALHKAAEDLQKQVRDDAVLRWTPYTHFGI